MTIEEYADEINKHIMLLRKPQHEKAWVAYFHNCKIDNTDISDISVDVFGLGKTPRKALNALSQRIEGERLIFKEGTDFERNYLVPIFDLPKDHKKKSLEWLESLDELDEIMSDKKFFVWSPPICGEPTIPDAIYDELKKLNTFLEGALKNEEK